MRILIESLRRLYKADKIEKEKVAGMVEAGTITQEEAEYITAE